MEFYIPRRLPLKPLGNILLYRQINAVHFSESEQCKRKKALSYALRRVGLYLSMRNRLCRTYIRYGATDKWDLENIVERLCRSRYLFDYTNYPELLECVRDKVNNMFVDNDADLDFNLDFKSYMYTILEEVATNNEWPEKWPWLE